jgi:uncharacterized protein HemX
VTPGTLADQLIAANPGPAAHLALLGVIVVIGLVVFAVHRRRSRHEQQTVDELSTPELPTDEEEHAHQSGHPPGHHGHPAEHKRRTHPQ